MVRESERLIIQGGLVVVSLSTTAVTAAPSPTNSASAGNEQSIFPMLFKFALFHVTVSKERPSASGQGCYLLIVFVDIAMDLLS